MKPIFLAAAVVAVVALAIFVTSPPSQADTLAQGGCINCTQLPDVQISAPAASYGSNGGSVTASYGSSGGHATVGRPYTSTSYGSNGGNSSAVQAPYGSGGSNGAVFRRTTLRERIQQNRASRRATGGSHG